MSNANGHMGDNERMATFGTRLNGLEAQVSSLSGKFDAFISTFNDRSRTPWGLLISLVMAGMLIVTTVGGLAYAPVIANLNRVEAQLKDNADNMLSVSAFLDFKASYNSNREISRNEYLDKFNNIKADHDKDVANLNRRIDELVAQLGGTYSLKDYVSRSERTMDDLQQKINDLEARGARTQGVQ